MSAEQHVLQQIEKLQPCQYMHKNVHLCQTGFTHVSVLKKYVMYNRSVFRGYQPPPPWNSEIYSFQGVLSPLEREKMNPTSPGQIPE